MEHNSDNIKALIKFVGVYLRKSRGDVEKDLEKHRKVLIEKCKEKNWKYLLYEEVESGESISMRPVMQKLMKDIENGLFDAVLVMDIDRLGRGDMGDQDKIKKVFAMSDTLVVTEKEVYNLNNDDDEFIIDMKGFIARREYKEIVKRLVRGKKIGSRMGMWTNGKPPYPYEYQRYKDKYIEKSIVVNDEKLTVYQFIKNSIIQKNMSVEKIAFELNKQEIPSPNGSKWLGVTVLRIAVDETHLGRIISNKSTGDAHKRKKINAKPYKKLPRSEWHVVENCHEAVKTIEEHEIILGIVNSRQKVVRRSNAKILPFTGFVECGICGRSMMIQQKTDFNQDKYIKACWYKNPEGHKCGNSGGTLNILNEIIHNKLANYEERLINEVDDYEEDKDEIIGMINIQKNIIIQKERALLKIQEAYEADVYTLSEFKKRKDSILVDISNVQEAEKALEFKLKHFNIRSKEEKIKSLKTFNESYEKGNLSDEELNNLYKTIIDRIIWKRVGNNIDVKVNFL